MAMADVVREDDDVAGRVEQSSRSEQHAGELRPNELRDAARAVRDQHAIAHDSSRIARRCSQNSVMQPHFREHVPGSECEVLQDEVSLRGVEDCAPAIAGTSSASAATANPRFIIVSPQARNTRSLLHRPDCRFPCNVPLADGDTAAV
jgi:hypothetical protein